MKRAIVPVAIAAALTFSQQASAIEFDGFLTAGFSVHDQDDATYLDAIKDELRSENDSKFGIQITADVAENVQVVAQILAAGSDDNYDLDVEWAYLDWQFNDAFSMRAGKVKEPVFLISDYIEVGYAYPWIRPPQEVYKNNPINTINGLDLLFQTDIGGLGLTVQPYFGSNTEAVPNTNGAIEFDVSNFYGAMVQLASPVFTFQVSFLQTDVATTNLSSNTAFDPFVVTGDAQLISAGISTDVNNFVGYAEYVTRDITEAANAAFPDQDAWYVTVGYRIGNFLPHLTVANSEADVNANNCSGPACGVSQDSVTLGMRYEINDSAAFKFEVQSIEPTANSGSNGLFNARNVLTDDKATLVSVAVDVIF